MWVRNRVACDRLARAAPVARVHILRWECGLRRAFSSGVARGARGSRTAGIEWMGAPSLAVGPAISRGPVAERGVSRFRGHWPWFLDVGVMRARFRGP